MVFLAVRTMVYMAAGAAATATLLHAIAEAPIISPTFPLAFGGTFYALVLSWAVRNGHPGIVKLPCPKRRQSDRGSRVTTEA